MELSPEKRESLGPCHTVESYPQPMFPWGLQITLENEQIDKLGMDMSVEAGDYITFDAIGKVSTVSSRDTDKGPQKSVSIQIVMMAVGSEHQEPAAPARKIDLGKFYRS